MGKTYYDLLGVTRNATADEIRRAYKQMALKYHPDKAGAAGAEMFKQVQTAYSTLSDPNRRQLYDTYGEEGMKVFDNEMMSGVARFFLSPKAAILMVVCMGSIVMLLLLFPILVALKVDGQKPWSWFTVFIPLFIFEGLVTVTSLLLICAKEPKTGDRLCSFYGFLQTHLWTAFTVLLCFGLQSQVSPWAVVFSPLLFAEFLALAHLPFNLSRKKHEDEQKAAKQMEEEMGLAGDSEESSYLNHVCSTLVATLWHPVFVLLVVLKLDHYMDASWAAVFSPIWVALSLAYFAAVLKAWCGSGHFCPDTVCVMCVVGVLLGGVATFFAFFAMKLTAIENETEGPKFMWIFSPIIAVLGLLVCCLMGCAPLAISRRNNGFPANPSTPRQAYDEENAPDPFQTPSSDTPILSHAYPTGSSNTATTTSEEQRPSSTQHRHADID